MRKCICLCMIFCLLLVSCAPSPQPSTLEIHMLDVGEADCLLIRQGKHAMLIDGGDPQDADRIVAYLHKHGIKTLEMIVLSHPHADHIGALQRVVEAYKVNAMYCTSFPTGSTPMYTRLADALERERVTVRTVTSPKGVMLGDAKVSLYPVTAASNNANDQMLVATVRFGGQHAVFMGDADEEAQKILMRTSNSWQADILKVSHHGAAIDSNPMWFNKTKPKVALISCGADNPYGHPHEKTVRLLESRGASIYRTDVHGDVVVTLTDSGERFITTAR